MFYCSGKQNNFGEKKATIHDPIYIGFVMVIGASHIGIGQQAGRVLCLYQISERG